MSSAWLLPEHFADVLPTEARQIERLRRGLLDTAERHGFELVIPPLVEHLESLLTGTGHALDLQTFKLVDQASGRTLGLRADSTPQVARIDAHLLGRQGVARLCYCGPVVHTRVEGSAGTREPLQFGAELYGHAGLEADAQILELALECLRDAGLASLVLDLGDARIVRGVLAGVPVELERLQAVHDALAGKDVVELRRLAADFPVEVRRALLALPSLYGDASDPADPRGVLAEARARLPKRAAIDAALSDLAALATVARAAQPDLMVGVDLADSNGYAYYSGMRFALYAPGASDAVARGGRYDEVGAVFGRVRPATGFSLDVKDLAQLLPPPAPRRVVAAPMRGNAALRPAVDALRARGEIVVQTLAGDEAAGAAGAAETAGAAEAAGPVADRALVPEGAGWTVRPA